MNQREIDITNKEVLPLLNEINPHDIGIIAPYRDQVAALKQQTKDDSIEVHTVHKFQGREKEAIILTTVDNKATNFSDDTNLLNVAISRAKKRLCLVVSGNEQPLDSNIGDFISYIDYNNFNNSQSEIRSVFDLLYSHYSDERIAFLRKHPQVSIFASENLMYCELTDIIESYKELPLKIACHQPIIMLIRNIEVLNEEEKNYIMNPATHIDFLIYNRISKKAVLAIEVDGFNYHRPGTKQYERDKIKDEILRKHNIPLLRFPTNGSEERAKIQKFFCEYIN